MDERSFELNSKNYLKKINPFIHHYSLNSRYDRAKLLLMSIFVLPLRVFIIILCLLAAYVLSTVGLWGVTKEEYDAKPFTGWRRLFRWGMGFLGRTMIRSYGFQWIVIKGKRASRQEAPILVVGPHSSYMDGITVFWSDVPGLVNRVENLKLPMFGKYINFTQPVYVWREDTNSCLSTIQEINRRAHSQDNWPQIMIFPEGTCTNRSCLITFKPGAFYPGVPVQPLILRYPNKTDCITWTWDGPGAFKNLWVTLCQFHNYCELEYLPVYYPSAIEMKDPHIYAANVRQVMANALGIPVMDYSYDDCRLMHKARQNKLPCSIGLIEFQKLRQQFGINLRQVEDKWMTQYAKIASAQGKINLEDFARHLSISVTEPALIAVFNLYDKEGKGLIDFRDFVIGRCEHSKAATTYEALEQVFRFLDKESKGNITADNLMESLKLNEEQSSKMFMLFNEPNNKNISYDEFESCTREMPEFAQILLWIQRSIESGTRSTSAFISNKRKAE